MRHCTQCGASTPDDARFCPRCGAAVAAAATSDASLGKVIADRYLLVEKIGQGGSGTIYRGEHTTLRKRVAVKVLHAQLSADDRAIERFRREATTVAELDNEHILQVLDFGRTDDNRLFFAMEFLEGEPLTKLIERDKWLTVPRTTDILGQIAEALMEAHNLGYIHRDLRPRNVFLTTKRGRADFVKLLDFGLSKLIVPNSEAKQTAMGMTFGDPRYMSPEQARGETLDRRSDIYSLGAIAFEMLVGTPPYTGSGTFEILQQHLDAPVPSVRERRADCPEWLDAVVRRALAKKPAGRFLTVAQVIDCLRTQTAPPALDAAQQAEHAKLTSEAARSSDVTMGKVAPAPMPPAAKPAPVVVAPVAAGPAVPNAPAVKAAATSGPSKTVPMPTALAAALAAPAAQPVPAVSTLAAAMGPPTNGASEPAARSPRETQSMMAAPKQAPAAPTPAAPVAAPVAAAPAASVAAPVAAAPPAPKLPEKADKPENKKAKPDARRAPADVPSAAQSGSVDMTPASTPQLDPQNVPSVVVESASGERTVPVKLSHFVAAAAAPSVDESRAVAPPPPPPQVVEPVRKHDRPPTGEWFANESEPLRGSSTSAYDDLDELPKTNKGPVIIGIVAGGLLLAVGVVILLLPKPVHKPLRGEEALATNAAPTSGVASTPTPAAPTTPPIAAAPTPAAEPATTPPPAVAAAPVSPPPVAKPIVAAASPVTKPTPAPEKPAVVVAPPPKSEPVVAAHPLAKEPPAHVEKVEPKAKPVTRVASTTRPAATTPPPSDRPTSSAKHDKSMPEGFKDPFASEPASAKNEAAQADFFIKLGRQKLGASDLSGAATNFNKAREFDPRSADAVAGLGEVAFEQGDYLGAAVHLKQALRLSPNRPRYLVLLGQAYYKLGKPKDAVGEYKKALRADPSNQEAQHSLDVAERKLQSGG